MALGVYSAYIPEPDEPVELNMGISHNHLDVIHSAGNWAGDDYFANLEDVAFDAYMLLRLYRLLTVYLKHLYETHRDDPESQMFTATVELMAWLLSIKTVDDTVRVNITVTE